MSPGIDIQRPCIGPLSCRACPDQTLQHADNLDSPARAANEVVCIYIAFEGRFPGLTHGEDAIVHASWLRAMTICVMI